MLTGIKLISWCLSLSIMILFLACAPERSETTTAGKMNIVADESLSPIVFIEVKEFMRIWQNADFSTEPALTRRAIERFLNQETRFIIISRSLKPDELDAIKEVGLTFVHKPIAYDAVCFMVNPKNSLKKLSVEQLRDILSGKITNWDQVGGKKMPIQLFVSSRNDGQYDFLKDSLLRESDFPPNAYPCSTAAHMKSMVKEFEGALGYTGMAHVRAFLNPNERDSSQFKVLALSPENDSTFYLPMQEHVYKHRYPLTYTVYYLYLKSDKLPLGFAAFLSKEGQKIFQRNGSVPYEPPIWVVSFKED